MAKTFFMAGGLFLLATCAAAQQPSSSQQEIDIPQETLDECLRSSIIGADDQMTVQQLKDGCTLLLQKKAAAAEADSIEETTEEEILEPEQPASVLKERLTMEALNRSNRFTLTPHKRNFILPISYKDAPNDAPYIDNNDELENLDHTEAEFQLSIKILLREGIFGDNGHLYLGYTNHTFWQVYNREVSAPFRETNQEPELILSFTNDWEIFGFRNVLNEGILNHQSNGQSGELSRSWNRIMFNTVFEKDNLVLSFTPWYRLPEDPAEYPGDPHGDDNPDIEKYMGNFELNTAYKRKDDIYSVMLRNNLRGDNKGAIELGWSFPISKKSPNIRGYVKYFNGYGQSLIDYDDHSQVLGIGFLLTDIL